MTAATDAVERDGNGFEDVLSASKFGRSATRARREGIAAWVHSKPFR